MSEPFRTRQDIVEAPEPEIESIPLESDSLVAGAKKLVDPLTEEEKTLDIWEGLNRKKFVSEYFDVSNIDYEFNLKMQTSLIDKFVRQELEKKGFVKNIDNWKQELQEIESLIGSSKMEVFKRIQKIVGYINAVNKYNKSKALRDKYLNSIQP